VKVKQTGKVSGREYGDDIQIMSGDDFICEIRAINSEKVEITFLDYVAWNGTSHSVTLDKERS